MKKILRLFLPKEREIHHLMKELSLKSRLMAQEVEKFLEEYNKIERNSRKSNASAFKNMKSEAEKTYRDAIMLLESLIHLLAEHKRR